MGKGQGRGRGKGGCEGWRTIHPVACCLCLGMLGGPILVAVGARLLVLATRNDRAGNIDMVQAAANTWINPAAPESWHRFQQLNLTAVLSSSTCANLTIPLLPSNQALDDYIDEVSRFQSVQQLRFTGGVSYNAFMMCKYQANVLQHLPSNTSILARLPPVPSHDYSILVDKARGSRSCSTRSDECFGSKSSNCEYNCESDFHGVFSCSSGEFECRLRDSNITNFAFKVSPSGDSGEYYVDPEKPGAGGGANVLPYGYERNYITTNLSFNLTAGSIFQVDNLYHVYSGHSLPPNFTFTVRSAADPWLSYMQATEGSGYFGLPKRALIISGAILGILGCLGCMFWCVAAFYVWRPMCSRSRPTERPQGMGGYAWDLANRYGGSYAPALGIPVHANGPNGLPTAQTYYVPAVPASYGGTEPAPGQSAHGYPYNPQNYPPPPDGTQPPHPGAYAPSPPYPPASYPPQGGTVQMSQQNTYNGNSMMPPYGYYPPPQQQDTAAAQYPPYPYPPYGQPTAVQQPTSRRLPEDGTAALPSAPSVNAPAASHSANSAAGDGTGTGPSAPSRSEPPAGFK